ILLAYLAGPLAAQAPDVGPVASVLASCWGRGDAEGVADLLAAGTVRLQLDAERALTVGERQARAALQEFLARRPGGRVRIERAQALGGNPPQGSVELVWEVAPPGSSGAVRYVVFVGLVREEG